MKATYQIFVSGGWATVTPWIFRSWQGQRQIVAAGVTRAYRGPVFLLGGARRAR